MIVSYFPHNNDAAKIREIEDSLIELQKKNEFNSEQLLASVNELGNRHIKDIKEINDTMNNLMNNTISDLITNLSTNHRHNASYINLDANHRFVTDAQITTWNGKANASHTHDDRYYTESEINTKLNGKSNTNHTHDDRYYTESEINTKVNAINTAINGKAASNHTHTAANVGAAAASHNHDNRYYTEAEINAKLQNISIAKNGTFDPAVNDAYDECFSNEEKSGSYQTIGNITMFQFCTRPVRILSTQYNTNTWVRVPIGGYTFGTLLVYGNRQFVKNYVISNHDKGSVWILSHNGGYVYDRNLPINAAYYYYGYGMTLNI